MKVQDLINQLESMDPDSEVVLSRDGEGNSYSPLSSLWNGAYTPETTWCGEVHLTCLDDDDRAQGYSEEDVRTPGEHGTVAAVILVPTA